MAGVSMATAGPWFRVVRSSPVRRSQFLIRCKPLEDAKQARSGTPGTPSFDVRLFPGLPQLQPVEGIFHQQLAGSFQGIILSLRKSLPILRHQDAPSIRMSGDVDAEHVIDLTLEPVRRGPDDRHRG